MPDCGRAGANVFWSFRGTRLGGGSIPPETQPSSCTSKARRVRLATSGFLGWDSDPLLCLGNLTEPFFDKLQGPLLYPHAVGEQGPGDRLARLRSRRP